MNLYLCLRKNPCQFTVLEYITQCERIQNYHVKTNWEHENQLEVVKNRFA